MTENKNVILSARDIVVEFDVRDRVLTAIRGVSLDLVEGEVLALVGESGSGKSVLTKTFTGMLEENGRVASGSIDYRGQDLTKLKSHQDWAAIRGAKIATIFQDPMTSLDPIKTIGSQIVEVIVKHQGKSAKEAKKMAIDYMDKVGIPDAEKRFNEYPFQYSGGMRQRIVIAIALACRPDVLICDEPTTALDVTIQAQIIDLLKSLKEEYGFSVIFITHDLGVVASIADKVAVMYAGEIIEYATVEEIFYEPCHPYTCFQACHSWLTIRVSFSLFQGHHHHFIHQLLEMPLPCVQTMPCKLTSRKKHHNSKFQILTGLRPGSYMRMHQKLKNLRLSKIYMKKSVLIWDLHI